MRKIIFLLFILFPTFSFGQDWSLTISPSDTKQGDVVIFQIQPPAHEAYVVAVNLRVHFLERYFKVIESRQSLIAISAIPAAQPRQRTILRGNDSRIRLRPGVYIAELLSKGRVVAELGVPVEEGEFEEVDYNFNYKGGSLSKEQLEKYRREVNAMNRSKVFVYDLLARTGFGDPLDEITVTSPFGKLRRYKNLPDGRAHAGTDLRASEGTDVKSIGNGRVEYVGIDHVFEGTIIIINHGGALGSRFEGVRSYYLHLSEVLIRQGQTVRKGQVIAKSGDSAAKNSPHLHIAMKINDIYIDYQKLKARF